MSTVTEIRSWPRADDQYHISPGLPWCKKGSHIRLGDRVTAAIDLGLEPERNFRRSLQHHPTRVPLFQAGCHILTLPEARQHWGVGYQGDRAIADAYLRLLDYCDAEATARWPTLKSRAVSE
jgi:hypothetical protein